MFHRFVPAVSLHIALVALTAAPAIAAPPTADQLLASMLAAAGSDEFGSLGVLKLTVDEQETASDGSTTTNSWVAHVDSGNLDNSRLELPGQIVVVRNQENAWASVGGALDDRQQTPLMARGTVNQKVFPLLLPFSLKMKGVSLGDVGESSFEGTPTWGVTVRFPRGFFITPSMETAWRLEVDRDSGRLLAADVLPPQSMREIVSEGLRYQTLQWRETGEAEVPSKLLMQGIDFHRIPNGHVRITTVASEVEGPFDPTLFVSPDRLEKLEEGDLPDGP